MAKKKHATGLMRYNRIKPATNVLYSAIFITLALICFLPALLVLMVSISSEESVMRYGYSFVPKEFSMAAYTYLIRQGNYIGGAFFNSLKITIIGTVIGLTMCSTMGYALSRPNYRLRGFFTWFIFIPMLFSGGLVASYMINAQILGLKNTHWALILPICCSSFYIVIMRTFFQSNIPYELLESAKMDGISDAGYLVKIVIPLSKASISVILLYALVGKWNSYFGPMIYLRDRNLYPLQLVVREILNAAKVDTSNITDAEVLEKFATAADLMKYSLIIVSTLPMLILYPCLQKFFQKGVMIGSIKG